MRKLNLYTTLGCHLCENAEELVKYVIDPTPSIELSLVEIADSKELMELYALTIPVVKFDGGFSELNWPFDVEQFKEFLAMHN